MTGNDTAGRIQVMENKTTQSNVKGTITEHNVDDVRGIFGEEIANKLKDAGEGDTFLNLLFEMEKK